jgi:hypothetical protein
MITLLNSALLCTLVSLCFSLLTATATNSTVKEYLKTAESDWPTMLKRLEAIRASLIKRNQFIINLTGVLATMHSALNIVLYASIIQMRNFYLDTLYSGTLSRTVCTTY